MLGAFDEVDSNFADIELFLQMYPGDQNIERASINLIASTLFAVENVMAFFLKSTSKFAIPATPKVMMNSLNAILHSEKNGECELAARELRTKDSGELRGDQAAVRVTSPRGREDQQVPYSSYNERYLIEYVCKSLPDPSTCQGCPDYNCFIGTVSSEAALQQISENQVQRHELKDLMNEVLEDLYLKTVAKFNQQLNQQRREDYRQVTHFCLAFADALSGHSSPGHPPQIQMSPAPVAQYISPQQILDWINIPDLASQDLEYLAARERTLVSEDGRARAEQLIRTRQMREWMSAPASSQLLVHGNYDRRAYISGLSLFCASLAGSLAEKAPRFFRILFFCGLHVDPPVINGHSGGHAMIASLICQLLCQYDFSGQLQQYEISQDRIRQGDVESLCALFERLVRHLPGDVVLFCLIDGIMYYEREEFRDDMERVLRTILQVSADHTTSATFKVLITSPTKTTEVREPFPEDLILSMDAMPQAGAAASGRRLKRELGAELQ